MSETAPMTDFEAHLFAEQRAPIYRFLLGMTRDVAEAEDLTQETLLRAHTRLASLDDESKAVAWLYRIAANAARDRFRQTSRRPRAEPLEAGDREPLPAELDRSPRLDKVMEQREMSECVRRYMENLSDSYRTVIVLHDLQGLTNPEIAHQLGVTVDAVKIRLYRARVRLREALGHGCTFSRDVRGVTVCEPRSDPAPSAAVPSLRGRNR